MRAGIGLLVLLIGTFIAVYMWSNYTATISPIAVKTEAEAQHIAGRDSSGAPVTDALQLSAVEPGGKFKGVVVNSIVAGSEIQSFYGLQVGDEIIEADHMQFEALLIDKASDAKDWILKMYQEQRPLTVMRDGQKLDLPRAAALPGSPVAPTQTPATPAPGGSPAGSPVPPPISNAPAAPPKKPQQPSGGIYNQIDQIRQQSEQQGQ